MTVVLVLYGGGGALAVLSLALGVCAMALDAPDGVHRFFGVVAALGFLLAVIGFVLMIVTLVLVPAVSR